MQFFKNHHDVAMPDQCFIADLMQDGAKERCLVNSANMPEGLRRHALQALRDFTAHGLVPLIKTDAEPVIVEKFAIPVSGDPIFEDIMQLLTQDDLSLVFEAYTTDGYEVAVTTATKIMDKRRAAEETPEPSPAQVETEADSYAREAE